MGILIVLAICTLASGLFETAQHAYIVHCNQKKRSHQAFEVEYY